jgi:ribonuclease Z
VAIATSIDEVTGMIRFRGWTSAALAIAAIAVSGQSFAFDGIRLTLLGTGSPHQSGAHSGPATLIEAGDEVLLIDCGPGTMERMDQAGVAVSELTGIFLTSLDPAHIAGCRELWSARQQAGRGLPPVWGPHGTRDLLSDVDRQGGAVGPPTEAYDVADNVIYQPEGVTVTAFVTDYPATPQAFGYRIDASRRSVTLSGDTRYSQNLVRYARGAQVLVHEVAAASAQSLAGADVRRIVEMHTSPEEAGKVFRDARPYLAVYSHIMLFDVNEEDLMRRTRRAYRGPVEIGRDLMVIEVQNEVQVRSSPSDGPRAGR